MGQCHGQFLRQLSGNLKLVVRQSFCVVIRQSYILHRMRLLKILVTIFRFYDWNYHFSYIMLISKLLFFTGCCFNRSPWNFPSWNHRCVWCQKHSQSYLLSPCFILVLVQIGQSSSNAGFDRKSHIYSWTNFSYAISFRRLWVAYATIQTYWR